MEELDPVLQGKTVATGSKSTWEGLESFNKNRTVWQLYPFGSGFEASLLEEQFRSSKIHQDCGSVEYVSGGLGKPRYERQWKKGMNLVLFLFTL